MIAEARPLQFTWLHLTDLHIGQGWQHRWPDVQSAVTDDIERLAQRLRSIDVVFFTGDLVQRGSADEYASFGEVLDRIIEAASAGAHRPVFLCVPGNHDLARPGKRSVDALARAVVSDLGVREEFWTDADGDLRRAVDRSLAEFTAWTASRPADDRVEMRKGLLPGDFVATVQLGRRRLGVVGLNTTALQLGDGDKRGMLTLDARQISHLWPGQSGGDWAAQHDATVLLTHHPPDWLDETGRTELDTHIAPRGRFTAHLFGHQHEEADLVEALPGGPPRIRLLGRSLFGLERYEDDKTRMHGFSAAWLQVRPLAGRSELRLWPREAEAEQRGAWRIVANTSLELLDDEGTKPQEVAAGFRGALAPTGDEPVAPAREGAADMLAAALETAEQEYARMSLWWDGERSPLPRRAGAIESKLLRILDPAERLLRDLREHVARNEPRAGWRKYAELRTEHLPRIANELLAVIGGLFLAEGSHDFMHDSRGLSFSSVARNLVDALADDVQKPRAEILIVGEERQEAIGPEIIRLRFPACDLWNLPFAAHEYGYLVGQHYAPTDLSNLKHEVYAGVDPETRRDDPPDLACYLRSVRQYRAQHGRRPATPRGADADRAELSVNELQRLQVAQVSRLFADAFATYFVGPAYVRALLLLRMRPDDTLFVPRGTMPPFTQRFVFALETLNWVRRSETVEGAPLLPPASAALAQACDDLEQTWRQILADAGKDNEYDDVQRMFHETAGRPGWLQQVWWALGDRSLQRWRVPAVYGRWQSACKLEAALADGEHLPADADPWAVVNAAWSLRARGHADLATVETRALDLLARITAGPPEPDDNLIRRRGALRRPPGGAITPRPVDSSFERRRSS